MLRLIDIHPIFVHFTVALFTVAFIFYFISLFFKPTSMLTKQMIIVANWSLWLCAGFTVLTIIAGFYAYFVQNINKTGHPTWGMATFVMIVFLALWAFNDREKNKKSLLFLLVMLIGFLLLTKTAYLGGKWVYQHGYDVQQFKMQCLTMPIKK